MSQMGVYGVGARRAARSSGASGTDTGESLSSAPMAYITGKQAFLQILRQEGVSYRILKQRTKALKGFSAEDDRYVAIDLDKPLIDFVGLARALGVPGARVEKASDIGPAVSRGLASGGPYLVEVRIDPAFA
ncbi:MAG: hypothetical protein DMD99_03700 [Candidatus Rokuibacteriota bacterium]|nr:MAG: hypothetical protein DMD99_03700 [Candidatus Rokubacteria bacterium]